MDLPGCFRRPWPSLLIVAALALGGSEPAAAQILAQPPALGYPPALVGQPGAPQTLLLRNVTPLPQPIHLIHLGGPHATDFQLSPAACPQPVLGPGQVCRLDVTFAPRQAGPREAVIVVVHSSGAILDVRLQGHGLAAALRFAPGSLPFGSQAVGSPPTQRALAIFNDGPLDLHITQLAVAGAAGADFQQVSACTQAPVAPGNWCPTIVSFSPTGPGPRNATLVVTSNHTGVPGTQSLLPLSGDTPRPGLLPLPGTVEFGFRPVGVRGPDLSLQLQNTGSDTLVITQLGLAGSQAGEFVIPAGYTCSAAAGQACTVPVGFVPGTALTRAAELVVTSNVPGPALRVLLRGNGQFPALPATLPTDDHRFLSDGVGLVPTCGTQAAPPPNLVIPVRRVVGPVPPGGGPLLAPGPLVAAGALSGTATLDVAAYNVRSGPGQTPPSVILNGVFVGFLAGQPGTWSVTTLTVPIGTLRFPTRGTPTPAAALNVVTLSVSAPGQVECAAPAWARLGFLALSPVVFVHGNGSNGAFFVRQGMAGFLDGIGIPNDRGINLPTTTIAGNAATLQTRLPAIAASFGVNSIHVVAHSKGGLDMRSWLGTFGTANGFRVLSLTTLATPHRGSPLADAALALNATGIGVPGLPMASLSFLGGSGPALSNLSTPFASGFNPPLPSGADYQAIGADADRLFDGAILSFPVDEYAGARVETAALAAIFAASPPVADGIVTAIYTFMRHTMMVGLTVIPVPLPIPPFFIPITVPLPIPNFVPAQNDLLVSMGSALGAPAPFVTAGSFTGPVRGRDHASIADGPMGASVLGLLVATDTLRGDLR